MMSVYSDHLDLTFNMYNVNLLINCFEEGESLRLGTIKVSPTTAKAFLKLLQTNLEQYEELYGEIPTYTEEIKQKEKELDKKLKEEAEKKAAKEQEDL